MERQLTRLGGAEGAGSQRVCAIRGLSQHTDNYCSVNLAQYAVLKTTEFSSTFMYSSMPDSVRRKCNVRNYGFTYVCRHFPSIHPLEGAIRVCSSHLVPSSTLVTELLLWITLSSLFSS